MEISSFKKVYAYKGDGMKYNDEKKYIGNRSQLLRAMRVQMQEGKAKGVEMVDVQNSSGMHFDINLSRGMDIPFLDFEGQNFGFISPCGIVAPEYFDDKELGFLKSFTCGFMTTCGLKMAGAPCEYEGQSYGLHGNASHTPAEEVTCILCEDEEVPYIRITGKIRDAIIFGDKLVLEREIKCYYKERKISVRDKVTNEGYKKARHMIVYHCNLGYPLLSDNSEIFIPSTSVHARNNHAQEGIDVWTNVENPNPDYEEMCYYHDMKKDENNMSTAAIFNPDLNMGVAIEFDTDSLDHFVQWKMMGAGDYVMGLEPANSTIDGMKDAVENKSMKYIEPGEYIEHYLNFYILSDEEEMKQIKEKFK